MYKRQVQLHAPGDQGDLGRHVQRYLRGGVQGDRRPHPVGRLAGDAVGVQEPPCLLGAVDLEPPVGAGEAPGQSEVVEHRPDVEQLGVEVQPLLGAAQRPEQEHPAGVVEQQRRGGLPHQLGRLLGQGAVRDPHSGDRLAHLSFPASTGTSTLSR